MGEAMVSLPAFRAAAVSHQGEEEFEEMRSAHVVGLVSVLAVLAVSVPRPARADIPNWQQKTVAPPPRVQRPWTAAVSGRSRGRQ